jgi:hypothetical protein
MGLPVEKSNPSYDRLDSLGGTDDGNNAARADGWPKSHIWKRRWRRRQSNSASDRIDPSAR